MSSRRRSERDDRARQRAKRLRIEAIVDAARVREAIGEAALHQVLRDGGHEITYRGQRHTGATVAEAIAAAQARGG